jgi:Fic family protein
MEPMIPRAPSDLMDLSVNVVREAGAIGAKLHPLTQQAIAGLLRNMNSYYSNLIEGHRTHPVDIERALRHEYSPDSKDKALQLEGIAHIGVEMEIDARLSAEPGLNPCSTDFICWIHAEFYKRMPEKFLTVKDPSGKVLEVKPGKLRSVEVEVGRHVPPAHASLPRFLDRFAKAYDISRLGQMERIIAAAASHHRLAWIHPFLDGNGRVARLFTHAYLKQTKIDGQGLWAISRGFARKRDEYMKALAFADLPRMGDLDGRGNLSEKGLVAFCHFFLQTALDQITFMSRLLDMDQLLPNIRRYTVQHSLNAGAATLLADLAVRGEMPRGEAAKHFGLASSQARRHLNKLLRAGLVSSPSQKGPLRMAFPMNVVPYYFPKLFPAEIEFDLDNAAK